MAVLFQVKDPRGLRVTCTYNRWYNHILDNHSIMDGTEEEVKAIVQRPLGFIYGDRNYPNRHIYYGRSKIGKRYIKVVVEFNNPHRGEVVTAFATDSSKQGEFVIWPI